MLLFTITVWSFSSSPSTGVIKTDGSLSFMPNGVSILRYWMRFAAMVASSKTAEKGFFFYSLIFGAFSLFS